MFGVQLYLEHFNCYQKTKILHQIALEFHIFKTITKKIFTDGTFVGWRIFLWLLSYVKGPLKKQI